MQLAVGYPVQIINPKRDESARNDREVAPVRVVLVITRGDLRKIIISLEIVARNPVAIGINLGKLPPRQRFAASGGKVQSLDRGGGISPRTKNFDARLQCRPRCREGLERRLIHPCAIGALERANARTRQTSRQAEKHDPCHTVRCQHRHLSHLPHPDASQRL